MLYTSTSGAFRTKSGQVTRRRRNEKTENEKCASSSTGYDFLKQRFLPVRENLYPFLKNRKKVETTFFNSLINLASLYNFPIVSFSSYVYPYNIYKAFQYANVQMKTLADELQLLIIRNEIVDACIATVKTFDTGTTLYYIPVRPLNDLLKDKKNRQKSGLLLCIYSWLYTVVKILFFTNNDNYINSCYQTLEEWYTDEAEENAEQLAEIKTMLQNGSIIKKKIDSNSHLQMFEKRIQMFSPVDHTEEQLLLLAKDAFELYSKYPTRSAFENIRGGLITSDNEDQIYPDQYLSFFWDSEGHTYEALMDYVSTDLQELSTINEPVAIQLFNEPQEKEILDLNFEKSLFGIIETLCTILNEL